MSLHLIRDAEDNGSVEDAMSTLAEVATVVDELRRFVTECRQEPSCMEQPAAADLAQAKALLAEARAKPGDEGSAERIITTTGKKRPRDPVQLGKLIAEIATGQMPDAEKGGKNDRALFKG